jgi:hypothetical protein
MLRLANRFALVSLAATALMLGGCAADADPGTDDAESISSEVKGGKGKGGSGGGGGGGTTPPPPPTYVTCAGMHGRTVTAPYVSEIVSMRAGETITATVSPAREGDSIILSVAIGLSFTFYEKPATTGFAYTATQSTNHSFGWSLEAAGTRPESLTWTFRCSSGG